MELAGKTAVITGAGAGIGRELAWALGRKGAGVAAVDRDESGLAGTVAGWPGSADELSTHTLDVSDRRAVAALPAAVMAAHGAVDIVVNNAGIAQRPLPIGDLTPEEVEHLFAVNWWGAYYVTLAFLPHLRQRPAAHLMNVASFAAIMPIPTQAAYSASKAALRLFTEALAQELRGSSIGVTIVFPGAVATGIIRNASHLSDDEKTLMDLAKVPSTRPEAAAAQMVRALERGQSRLLIGRDAKGLDLLYRLAPGRATAVVARLLARMRS